LSRNYCSGTIINNPGSATADLTKKLKTFWFDHRTDLPHWISAGIGQAVAEWSVL